MPTSSIEEVAAGTTAEVARAAAAVDVPASEAIAAAVDAVTATTIATKPSKPASTFKRVSKTSLNLKSDISKEQRDSCFCGILHATKSVSFSRGDEHAFVWVVDNIDDDYVASSLMAILSRYGFRATSQMRFIPYSSKAAWLAMYPQAVPYLECDPNGKISGSLPHPLGGAASAKSSGDTASAKAKKKAARNKKAPPKLLEKGRLPNAEREELHREIYSYFTWLHEELSTLETSQTGRRQVSMAGVSVPALQSLVAKMEGAFKGLQQLEKENNGAADGGNNITNLDSAMAVEPSNTNGGGGELPFLEQALERELQSKVIAKMPYLSQMNDEKGSTAKGSIRQRQPREASWRKKDFDNMFQELINFQAEKGHTSPPVKHPELGRWVTELRANKKLLQEKGLEYELEEVGDPMLVAEPEAVVADVNAMPLPHPANADVNAMLGAEPDATKANSKGTPKSYSHTPSPNTFLSKDRVDRLDSINFTWSIMPVRVTWEQRFEELRQFKEQNGRFPTNKEGTLGNWLKSQRKLYTKNDADFMAKKCPRFEEIGVPLRQRNFTALGWDDRFQQLVEFGRVNRHFNVPNPAPDNVENRGLLQDSSSDTADANRFYKFVSRIHSEYRGLQRGIASSFLTEERIVQLQSIGFEFNTKQDKDVPEIDWSTRIQQLEAFQSEMGHMRVDPNYDKYSNLGGWAVEISEQHKNWQEGREYLQPDLVEKFNHLSALGFGFDVFRSRRGERSWDDSFNLLQQYRHETGSCRVPHHYKADFRLGSWVAVQRKEYKMAVQGKPSRLTHERIQRLESVGFEFVARRIGVENEPE